MSETSILDDDYLHRLAFYGDIEQLEEELRKCTSEDKVRLDAQGNTVRLSVGMTREETDVCLCRSCIWVCCVVTKMY